MTPTERRKSAPLIAFSFAVVSVILTLAPVALLSQSQTFEIVIDPADYTGVFRVDSGEDLTAQQTLNLE